MRHHQDRCPGLLIDALHGTEEHLGRMAVQGTGGFIGQEQLRFVDDRPGAGAALFLAAGHLIGIFVQNIRDADVFLFGIGIFN